MRRGFILTAGLLGLALCAFMFLVSGLSGIDGTPLDTIAKIMLFSAIPLAAVIVFAMAEAMKRDNTKTPTKPTKHRKLKLILITLVSPILVAAILYSLWFIWNWWYPNL